MELLLAIFGVIGLFLLWRIAVELGDVKDILKAIHNDLMDIQLDVREIEHNVTGQED
jgi:hypothetical protein